MKSYRKMWEELKLNITDQETLKLMKEYEQKRYRKKRNSIIASEQPWYRQLKTTRALMASKILRAKNPLPESARTEFNTEYLDLLKKLETGEITNAYMTRWLKNVHKDLLNMIEKYRKPKYTESGFKRKTRSELSSDECAAIVIDELVNMFVPQPQIDINLNIEYYKEDWKQELWCWCWYQRYRDPNLSTLIHNYNALGASDYAYCTKNILSRMNRYITSYIGKLQYSCNEISRYTLNDKYYEDKLYPSDDINSIDNMNLDIIEKQKYIKNDIEMEDNSVITKIFKLLEDYGYIRNKKVLEMRYGFNSENRTYTLEEIGNYLGVTRERVRQIEKTTLAFIEEKLSKEVNNK